MTQRRSRFTEELIIPVGWAVAAAVTFAAIQLGFAILRWTHHSDLPLSPGGRCLAFCVECSWQRALR